MIVEKQVVGSVAYRGHGAVREEFMWSWGQLIQYTNEFYLEHPRQIVHWMRGNQSGQVLCSNYLAATMAGDWLLFLDVDHAFEPDLLYRMLKVFNKHDLDILTGLYTMKNEPYNPVVYGYSEEAKGYKLIIDVKKYGPGELMPVGCAGMGTLLVRRRVFERIASELGEAPFSSQGGRYENDDFNFFDRCRKLGIQAFCCPSIQTYHLAVVERSLDDYDEASFKVGETVPFQFSRV